MGIQMDEAEGCPRLTCIGNQPFKHFGIWRTMLKSYIQRLFRRDETFPGSYGVFLHLRPDRLDVAALLFGQTDFIRKLKQVSWSWDTVKLGGARKFPSAAARDFIQVLFRKRLDHACLFTRVSGRRRSMTSIMGLSQRDVRQSHHKKCKVFDAHFSSP